MSVHPSVHVLGHPQATWWCGSVIKYQEHFKPLRPGDADMYGYTVMVCSYGGFSPALNQATLSINDDLLSLTHLILLKRFFEILTFSYKETHFKTFKKIQTIHSAFHVFASWLYLTSGIKFPFIAWNASFMNTLITSPLWDMTVARHKQSNLDNYIAMVNHWPTWFTLLCVQV